MGLPIRDERQLKACTGLSHAEFAQVLPVFSAVYAETQQQTSAEGVMAGTRTRQLGGGAKGTRPTLAEKLLCVLSYSQTSPTFDVCGTQGDMVRSNAHENL